MIKPVPLSVFLFLSLFGIPGLFYGSTPLWIESDGVLVMEAEKGTAVGNEAWAVRTDVADYVGEGFIRWEGSDSFTSSNHGRIDYRFYIQKPGIYSLYLRTFHDPVSHGKRPDEENDCWTNEDLGDANSFVKTYRSGLSAGLPWTERTLWFIDEKNVEAEYTLGAGEHTFRLAARAQNFMIDRIVLFRQERGYQVIDIKAPESLISGATYAEWLDWQFTGEELGNEALEAKLWGPSADPDEDGLANALEFYSGGNPWVSDAAERFEATTDGQRHTIRLLKAAWIVGYTVKVEASSDLSAWEVLGNDLVAEELVDAKRWKVATVPMETGVPSYLRFVLEAE